MREIMFWPSDAQLPRVATVYRREDSGLVKQAMPMTPYRATSTSAVPAVS